MLLFVTTPRRIATIHPQPQRQSGAFRLREKELIQLFGQL